MSSSPDVDDELQVTVKRVPGGVVSNWMIDNLGRGDVIEATCPAGVFCLPYGDGEVVAFAAGSGITPVLSILKTALATTSRGVRLLYANRDRDSIIFSAELDRLGERHPARVEVVHCLDVERGFIEAGTVQRFAGKAGAAGSAGAAGGTGGAGAAGSAGAAGGAGGAGAEYFICGPAPFMEIVEGALLGRDVDDTHIHIERFTPPASSTQLEPVAADTSSIQVTIELGGRSGTATHHPGTTILQTARQMGMAPPFSCESGSCATCMARLVEGNVKMHVNNALTEDEVADGLILTCQSVPISTRVHVVYEEA
jgi:ferredoxin-NADP reductase